MRKGAVAGVIWHDVECGGYHGDLELWGELAAAADGPVLELGCGAGRVALALARHGHEVWGIDNDPALVAELRTRAAAEALPVRALEADLRDFDLGTTRPALALAPMQVLQLLPDEAARAQALRTVRAHLPPGGLLAAAIVEGADVATRGDEPPPLPDVRELEGWLYSSLPVEVLDRGETLEVRRLRQRVSPGGELEEETDVQRLAVMDAERVEAEGRRAGLVPAGRATIEPTSEHVGSTVLLLRREAG